MTRNQNTRTTRRPSNKARGKRPVVQRRQPQRVQQRQKPRKATTGVLSLLGGAAGGAIGGYFGGPTGSRIGGITGSAAGSAISQLTGLGSYRVKNNVFATGQGIPSIYNPNNKPGCILIRHKEYLGDLVSSSVAGEFKIQSFLINPALLSTFPWLSQIASNYEEYEFQGLLFEFRSMSADALNSVNTALGTVMMATNYNVLNPNFRSKAEMDAYEYSNSSRPSETLIHLVECSPQQNVLSELYCRTSAVPSDADPRFYDLGKFQIATSGMQGTSVNVGEIWVSYQVALLKPKLFAALGAGIGYFHYSNDDYTNAAPLGSGVATVHPRSNMTIVVGTDTLRFPTLPVNREYEVVLTWKGTVSAGFVVPTDALSGGVGQSDSVFPNGSYEQASPENAISCKNTEVTAYYTVLANSENPVITYSGGTLSTGTRWIDIRVIQIPLGIAL